MNTKNNSCLDLERPRLHLDRFVSSAQEGNVHQRDNPRIVSLNIAKQPLIKPKIQTPFVRSPAKDSLRERKIKEWAFKKIELKDLLKSKEIELKNQTQQQKKEIIVDENEFFTVKKIDLSELIDTENDEEFYRQFRNSGMYKNRADAQKNILLKLLDKRLLDISKDRFKIINHVDYQKKIFIKKQLLKSKSLPGLNCVALETFNPHQFDQLQDMEAALNNIRKKEKGSRAKSGSKKFSFANSSYLLSRSRENNMIRLNDSLDFGPEDSDKISNQNSILNLSKSVGLKKVKSSNQLSFDSNINDNLNESLVINNNLTSLIVEESINAAQRASTFHGRETIKPGSIYRFQSKTSARNSKVYENEDGYRSVKAPVIDHRFNNLINFIKPCYVSKKQKDVNKIIDENEALKSINLNIDSPEKNKKLRDNGGKLADIALRMIEAGEYSVY